MIGHTLTESSTSNAGNDKFENDYTLHKKLGAGSFGTVYVTKHIQSSEEFAVKTVNREKLSKKDDITVKREISILKDCRDAAGIVRLIDYYKSPKQFHLVLIYAKGGDLFERLAKRTTYSEKDARVLAVHLLTTIDALHSRKIVHRDLKPENLLLRSMMDDSDVLLADFGFATYVSNKGLTTRCGTPAFVAPEVVVQNSCYDEQVDMWSVGCLLYMLLGGYPPFQEKTHRALFQKVRGADFCFHERYWDNVSLSAKQLISSLLTVDPKFRCTARMALEKSYWLKMNDKTLMDNDLSSSIRSLKEFQARRSLKGAVHAVLLCSTTKKFKLPANMKLSKKMNEWDKDDEAKHRLDAATSTEFHENFRRPSVTFSDVYEKKDRLYKGPRVAVYDCFHREGQVTFAVKIIDRTHGGKSKTGKSLTESVLHEMAVMRSLKHTNVVKIVDFFEDDNNFYLVMERMGGGDLFDRIMEKKKYTEKSARDFSKTLLEGLSCIHAQGIAHRDLKPQNILLKSKDNDADLKIGDFSFACRVHTPRSLTTRCGTPSFVAPEILKNIPYDQGADMWSFGVILYTLLCGYPPFQDEDQGRLLQNVRQGNWTFHGDDWKDISSDAKDLIKHLLVVDPLGRWTATQALQSKWLRDDDAVLDTDLSHIPTKIMTKHKPSFKNIARGIMWMKSASMRHMDSEQSSLEPVTNLKAVEEILARPED